MSGACTKITSLKRLSFRMSNAKAEEALAVFKRRPIARRSFTFGDGTCASEVAAHRSGLVYDSHWSQPVPDLNSVHSVAVKSDSSWRDLSRVMGATVREFANSDWLILILPQDSRSRCRPV